MVEEEEESMTDLGSGSAGRGEARRGGDDEV
jgi:hypothetical protein